VLFKHAMGPRARCHVEGAEALTINACIAALIGPARAGHPAKANQARPLQLVRATAGAVLRRSGD
jgi:hypothetical protein